MFVWGYYIKMLIIPILVLSILVGFFCSSKILWKSWFFCFDLVYVSLLVSDILNFFLNIRPYLKILRKIRLKKSRVIELKRMLKNLG
jgi:hypothetical protein